MPEQKAICYCGEPIHTEQWTSEMKPIWLHANRKVSCYPDAILPGAKPRPSDLCAEGKQVTFE